MQISHSTRMLAAAFLWVTGGFIAMNHIVERRRLDDWWLPLLLFALGLVIYFFPERAPSPQVAPAQPVPTGLSKTAAPAAKTAQPDDLTLIEGIGPKMSAALKAAGLDSFAKVARATEADLRAAIQNAGMRFAPSLTTWAEQAAFAAVGDWDGLKKLQQNLTAGRRD